MNLPTLIVGTIVAIVFVACLVHEIKKRRKPGGSCSCDCSSCGSCGGSCCDHK